MSDTKAAWDRVTKEAARLTPVHLRDLFARAPDRFERLSFQDEGLLIDLSKEKLDQDALSTLLDLARAVGLEEQRDRMLRADRVNTTERRAALHVALRGDADPEMEIDGVPVTATAHEARDQMLRFADDVRTGRRTASDGAAFSDVVNIGIGGSDLGPAMATEALAPYADGPGVHYVSNADGAHFADLSLRLDPARTLVIVASKTFSTPETMENAAAARRWLQAALGKAADTHLAAVSRNLEATAAFGVTPAQVFPMWDWVGGRYSVWSSIGLPLAIAIGPGRFKAFLDGAAAMDRHFRTAPAERNLPILMALQTVWRRNGLGLHAAAVLPYDQRLSRFPAWLQQLDMES
ncbi:MAG: glucose-6-phosphate isomerase, partial [Pseudomonadota bacterium]